MNYTKRKLDDAVVLTERHEIDGRLNKMVQYIFIDGAWYERVFKTEWMGSLSPVRCRGKIAELYHAAWPEMYGEPQKKEQAQ